MSRSDRPASPTSEHCASSLRTEFAWAAFWGLDTRDFPLYFELKHTLFHSVKGYGAVIFSLYFLFFTIIGYFYTKTSYFYLFLCLATVGSGVLLAFWVVFVLLYQGGEGFNHRLDTKLQHIR